MNTKEVTAQQVMEWLMQIPDPEIPVINIADLGVLRKVEEKEGKFVITITPTYSGCPALHAIEDEIKKVMHQNNVDNFKINTTLFPVWTTDWMSETTKAKLAAYGIAPPAKKEKNTTTVCPFCNSKNTTLTSWFGSTACKALHYCNNCNQPFEEFKCI